MSNSPVRVFAQASQRRPLALQQRQACASPLTARLTMAPATRLWVRTWDVRSPARWVRQVSLGLFHLPTRIAEPFAAAARPLPRRAHRCRHRRLSPSWDRRQCRPNPAYHTEPARLRAAHDSRVGSVEPNIPRIKPACAAWTINQVCMISDMSSSDATDARFEVEAERSPLGNNMGCFLVSDDILRSQWSPARGKASLRRLQRGV